MRRVFAGLLTLLFCHTVVAASTQQCAVFASGHCELTIHAGQAAFRFEFATRLVSKDELVVTSISVSLPDGKKQALAVAEMMPLFADEKISLYAQDLNQDSHADIWLVTERGGANAYAVYWLYAADQKQFVSLGKYPWLTFNSKSGVFQSYERHGHGGRIYTRNEYRIEARNIHLLVQEKQIWDKMKKDYVKTVRRFP